MSLIEQLLSLTFSFLYGIIIYISYRKYYKYLYSKNIIISIFNSLLFVLDITLIFFVILYNINDGIINITFIIITIIVFLSLNFINLQKKCQ